METAEFHQQPNVLAVIPDRTAKIEYARRNAFILSILQTLCGGLSIIFQVLLDVFYSIIVSICHAGIWSGSIFIIVGIVGMFSSKKNSRTGIIIPFMVLSIIAAVFAGILLCFSTTGLLICLHVPVKYSNVIATIMHSLLLVISVTELIIAIISSAVCCRAVCGCCKSRPYQGLVYFYPAAANSSNTQPSVNSQQLAVFTSPGNMGYNIYPNINSSEVGTNSQSALPSYSQVTSNKRKEDANQFQYVNFN